MEETDIIVSHQGNARGKKKQRDTTLPPPEWLKLRLHTANVGKDVEQLELSYTGGRNGKELAASYKVKVYLSSDPAIPGLIVTQEN